MSGCERTSEGNCVTLRNAAATEAGLATLLLDLLIPSEEVHRRNVFDTPLLASRLKAAVDWAEVFPDTAGLPPCYFGASTGGGAAILAAAADLRIAAIVSRGGRPDLAGPEALARGTAPTLLIVGVVIELNAAAHHAMHCPGEVRIVPGAGHLFEEPGTLDQMVELASEWFLRHLGAKP